MPPSPRRALAEAEQDAAGHQRGQAEARRERGGDGEEGPEEDLGSGRIATSDIEAPNTLANLA
jgi:hypothetical protein